MPSTFSALYVLIFAAGILLVRPASRIGIRTQRDIGDFEDAFTFSRSLRQHRLRLFALMGLRGMSIAKRYV